MPIRRLLERTAFGPEECAAIIAAYEDALLLLRMKRGTNPEREEQIATKIIELAQGGLLDKKLLAVETVKRVLQ